jgi:cytochrome c oxidase subunit 3
MSATSVLRSEPAVQRRGGGEAAIQSLIPMGMWLTLVPVGMLFASLASAYVVRSGLATDWVAVDLPALVWLNTLVLLASGAALEIGRRSARRPAAGGAVWIWAALGLGTLFLAGQVAAWIQLNGAGIRLGTTPYGSFFYVLTGVHAAHLVVGLVALLAAALWPREGLGRLSRPGAVGAGAIYWHFMDLLWLGILVLLVLGR